jgi:DNA polymerase-3 subunit beta
MTTVQQGEFKKKLNLVGRSVAGKTTLPVLSNVLMRVEDSTLTLSSTNLDTAITTKLQARSTMDWSGTVPFKLLSDVVSALPEGDVTLAWDNTKATLQVQASRFKTSIRGIDADEFPSVPAMPTDFVDTFPSALLLHAFERVGIAAATDDSRPVLAGVLLERRNNALSIAAADGFRMAVETLAVEGEEDAPIIIPARTVALVASVLHGDTCHVAMTANQVFFSDNETQVMSRLIEGKYPDFRRILPDSYTARAVVDRLALIRAVNLAKLFAVNAQNVIKLEMASDGITLSANAAEVGDNQGDVDAVVTGVGVIAINVLYFLEVLARLDTQTVSIETQSSTQPLVVRPVGNMSDYVHVIMPMSLR